MLDLLDAVATMIFIFTRDNVLYSNPALQTASGRHPETLTDLLHPEDMAAWQPPVRNQVMRFRKADNTYFSVSLSVNPVTYQDNPAWLGTAIALPSSQNEERYRIISGLISDYAFACQVGPASELTLEWITNESFQRMTGYSIDEVESHEHLLLYHPDDVDRVRQDIQQVLKGIALRSEYRLITKQGEERQIEIYRHPVWDEQQQRVVRFYAVARDITERRRAEDALRLSEERYRIISELISDYAGSFSVEPDGSLRREWVTEGTLQRMTGYTLDDLNREGRRNFYHPDDQERVLHDIQRTVQGESTVAEYRLITKQGDERQVMIYRHPIRDEQQQRVIRFYVVAQDITERKRAEQSLQQNEQRYRIISELMSDYAYSIQVEPDGRQMMDWMTEESFRRMTGYAPADWLTLANGRLFHPDDYPGIQRDIQQVLAGRSVRNEYRIITRQGEERWISLYRVPVQDETGRVVRYYGAAQDITGRKRVEEALRESEELYRMLASHFPNGVVALFNQDLKFTIADGEGLALLGLTSGQMVGKTLTEIFPAEIAERNTSYLQAALAGSSTVVEVSFGDMWFEVHVIPVKNAGGQVTGGMLMTQNITARRKMEEMLRRQTELQVMLEKEQELSQVKNRLMGLITHEFRTPLAVISNSLGMLERYGSIMTEDKLQARFRQAYRQIEHLTEMLDDMALVIRSEMSRIHFKPEMVEIVAVCQEAIEQIATTLGVDHELHLSTPTAKQMIYADYQLLQLIIRNLLSNAVKYSPPGSQVEMRLSTDGKYCLMSVLDQGKGMSPAEQEHIFEPFYRSESVQTIPGLGLGLSIVRDAVEAHQGLIEVESTPGQGTCFTVRLPRITPG